MVNCFESILKIDFGTDSSTLSVDEIISMQLVKQMSAIDLFEIARPLVQFESLHQVIIPTKGIDDADNIQIGKCVILKEGLFSVKNCFGLIHPHYKYALLSTQAFSCDAAISNELMLPHFDYNRNQHGKFNLDFSNNRDISCGLNIYTTNEIDLKEKIKGGIEIENLYSKSVQIQQFTDYLKETPLYSSDFLLSNDFSKIIGFIFEVFYSETDIKVEINNEIEKNAEIAPTKYKKVEIKASTSAENKTARIIPATRALCYRVVIFPVTHFGIIAVSNEQRYATLHLLNSIEKYAIDSDRKLLEVLHHFTLNLILKEPKTLKRIKKTLMNGSIKTPTELGIFFEENSISFNYSLTDTLNISMREQTLVLNFMRMLASIPNEKYRIISRHLHKKPLSLSTFKELFDFIVQII